MPSDTTKRTISILVFLASASAAAGLFLAASADGVHLFEDFSGAQQIALSTSLPSSLLLWILIGVLIIVTCWLLCSLAAVRLCGFSFARAAYLDALTYLPLTTLLIIPLRYVPGMATLLGPLFLLSSTLATPLALALVLIVAALKVGFFRPAADENPVRLAPSHRLSDRAVGWIVLTVAAATFSAGTVLYNSGRGLGGDEPHYMIVAHSIVEDGDIYIEDDHEEGAWKSFTQISIDPQYRRRTADNRIVPVHRIGLPLLAAGPYAVAGAMGGMLLVALLAAVSAANVYWLAAKIIPNRSAVLLSTAWVSLSVPALPLSMLFFTEIPQAAFILVSMNMIVRRDDAPSRWPLAAPFIIWFLPWLHARGWVTAAALSILLLVKVRKKPITAAAVLAICALLSLLPLVWNWWLYGDFGLLSEVGQTEEERVNVFYIFSNIGGLLFDQEFGLLLYNPALVLAAVGLMALWRRSRGVTASILLVAVCAVGPGLAYQMWWGGGSTPARYAAMCFHLAALPLAALLADGRWFRRKPAATLPALFAIPVALILICHPDMLYNFRDGSSGMLTALSAGRFDVVEWWPSWFGDQTVFLLQIAALALFVALFVAVMILIVRFFKSFCKDGATASALSPLAGSIIFLVFLVPYGLLTEFITPGEPNGFQPRSRESELQYTHRYRHDDEFRIVDIQGTITENSLPQRGFSAERLFPREELSADETALRGRSRRLVAGKPELMLATETLLWEGDYELRLWLRAEQGQARTEITIYDLADAGSAAGKPAAGFEVLMEGDYREIRCPLVLRNNSAGLTVTAASEKPLRFSHAFLAARSVTRKSSWPLPADLFDRSAWRFDGYTLYCRPDDIYRPEGDSFWTAGNREVLLAVVSASPYSHISIKIVGDPAVTGNIRCGNYLVPVSFERLGKPVNIELPAEPEKYGELWSAGIKFEVRGEFVPAAEKEGSQDWRRLGLFITITIR